MHDDDAARAVAEQEHRQAGLARLGHLDDVGEVVDVVVDLLDEEALALRPAAAPMIQRVHGEPAATSCSATQRYCPLCELNPWEMTTTACGAVAGNHARVKILTPPIPSKLPSVMASNVVIRVD